MNAYSFMNISIDKINAFVILPEQDLSPIQKINETGDDLF